MRCSNCGKDVPFAGKVCPYCHVDKSKDQMGTMLSFPLGLAGAALGGFLLGFWGGVVGFVGGIAGAMVFASKAAKHAEEQRRLKQ